MQVEMLSLEDAESLVERHESHFFECKSKGALGKTLHKAVVAFANSDGGELFIGIEDERRSAGQVLDRWQGFSKPEEANQAIQTVTQDVKPSPPVELELYYIDGQRERGLVLRVNVLKSSDVHYAADKSVYVRKGAQNLRIEGDSITNLKLSKGLLSYEDQVVANYDPTELATSPPLHDFLQGYSPKTDPVEFLRKQRLIRTLDGSNGPTVAGLLLFEENPSAAVPKKCAVKISYYNTTETAPEREHLKEQHTVEGPLIEQINTSLSIIRNVIEGISVLGEKGLEKPQYPAEAIKEILVNAIIHRDYNISDDIIVLVLNNRIEVKNPGRLPGHITEENILEERFARNPTIVRLLNKYPDPPNKDIGEGLNTTFQRMHEMKLKPPRIYVRENSVIVVLPHEKLAKPEEAIMEYLEHHTEITNRVARSLTGIRSENSMKDVFYRLRNSGLVERIPGREGPMSAWRKVKKEL